MPKHEAPKPAHALYEEARAWNAKSTAAIVREAAIDTGKENARKRRRLKRHTRDTDRLCRLSDRAWKRYFRERKSDPPY